MDSMDNFRERFEVLEQQTEQLKHQTHRHSRQARWWWGIACGLLIVSLVSFLLPSATAQDEHPTPAEATHPVSYTFITVDIAGAFFTDLSGINDRGQIVGTFRDTTTEGRLHGFLFSVSGGRFTMIDVPGATDTAAFSLNNRGQIVGDYDDTSGRHGFLFDKGNFTTIDVPGATGTFAFGINNRGQIAGRYDNASASHGFLLDKGDFTTIDVPGSSLTNPFGINNRGQIVGEQLTGGDKGFLFDKGNFTTIDVPGSGLTIARGINVRGEIVGAADRHGFIAFPTKKMQEE